VGQTTTVGAKTWVLGIGTSPTISSGVCIGGAAGGGSAVIPVGRRNCLAIATVSALNTAVNGKGYIVFCGVDSNVFLRVDILTGGAASYIYTTLTGIITAPVVTVLGAGDQIAVDVAGDWVRVYRIRSGTWTLLTMGLIPAQVWTGTNVGIGFTNNTPSDASISAFEVR
jgi:hypothetical protein